MYPIHLWHASMPRMLTRTEPIRQGLTPQELGLYPQGQRQGQGLTPLQRTMTDSRTRISIPNPCLSGTDGMSPAWYFPCNAFTQVDLILCMLPSPHYYTRDLFVIGAVFSFSWTQSHGVGTWAVSWVTRYFCCWYETRPSLFPCIQFCSDPVRIFGISFYASSPKYFVSFLQRIIIRHAVRVNFLVQGFLGLLLAVKVFVIFYEVFEQFQT